MFNLVYDKKNKDLLSRLNKIKVDNIDFKNTNSKNVSYTNSPYKECIVPQQKTNLVKSNALCAEPNYLSTLQNRLNDYAICVNVVCSDQTTNMPIAEIDFEILDHPVMLMAIAKEMNCYS